VYFCGAKNQKVYMPTMYQQDVHLLTHCMSLVNASIYNVSAYFECI